MNKKRKFCLKNIRSVYFNNYKLFFLIKNQFFQLTGGIAQQKSLSTPKTHN